MPTPADTSSLIESGRGTVDTLMNQAADQAALGADVGTRIQEQFGSWQGTADAVAIHGLLPLAMTLLILHHFYQCAVEDKPFSVRYILIRTGVVAGLLMSYGFLVGLITGIAGSHGDWANWSQLMTPIEKGWQKRWDMYDSGFYLEDLPNLLLWLVFFAIVAFCALLALAASLLLSIAQGTLLAIILALGKTCIVVSLVPGISLGKSWAKYLAMVAAWSSVAGVVHAIVLGNPKIAKWGHLAASADVKYLLGLAALYLVFAAFTLAVPSITASLFSGAGSQGPGVMGALAIGMMGARNISGRGDKAMGRLRQKLGMPRAGDKGAGSRPHKARRASGATSQRRPQGRAAMSPHSGRAPQRSAVDLNARRKPIPIFGPIPEGTPGEKRWEFASARQKELFSQHDGTAPSPAVAPPSNNQAMEARIREQQPTLERAYPGQSWDPTSPTPHQRALLDELDNPHGRFVAWDSGRQGRGDFAVAEQLAARRVSAHAGGGARPAAVYRAPKWAAEAARYATPSEIEDALAFDKANGRPPKPAVLEAAAVVARRAPDAASPRAAGSNPAAATSTSDAPRPGAAERDVPRVHARVVPREASPSRPTSSASGDNADTVHRGRALKPSTEPPAETRRIHKLPPKGGR